MLCGFRRFERRGQRSGLLLVRSAVLWDCPHSSQEAAEPLLTLLQRYDRHLAVVRT
jgi:hypothetical protein